MPGWTFNAMAGVVVSQLDSDPGHNRQQPPCADMLMGMDFFGRIHILPPSIWPEPSCRIRRRKKSGR